MGYADNYKISNTSMCIGKGVYLPDNGGKDFWGNNLDKGSYDIGAHQTSVTTGQSEDTYVFTRDLSTQQGGRNWYYMEKTANGYQDLTWNPSENKWQGSGTYNLIWAPGNMHPDSNDTVLAWKAPKAGKVQIIGNPRKANTGNDGVNVKILQNDNQVWPANGWQYIGGSDTAGVSHDFTVTVNKDDICLLYTSRCV